MAPLLLLLCLAVAAGLYLLVIAVLPILLVRLGGRRRSPSDPASEPAPDPADDPADDQP